MRLSADSNAGPESLHEWVRNSTSPPELFLPWPSADAERQQSFCAPRRSRRA